jgi:hypothetical protein
MAAAAYILRADANAVTLGPETHPARFALHPWRLAPDSRCADNAKARIKVVVPSELSPDLIRGNAVKQVPWPTSSPVTKQATCCR